MDVSGRLSSLLWEYDPNGLVVLDEQMNVVIVNKAFCNMFKLTEEKVVGMKAEKIIGDISGFKQVWKTGETVRSNYKKYPAYNLSVRKVIFKVPSEKIVAGIFVDVTHEEDQKEELMRIRSETLEKAQKVIDKQMAVAQEIASLMGETTAETKVTLLKLMKLISEEERAR